MPVLASERDHADVVGAMKTRARQERFRRPDRRPSRQPRGRRSDCRALDRLADLTIVAPFLRAAAGRRNHLVKGEQKIQAVIDNAGSPRNFVRATRPGRVSIESRCENSQARTSCRHCRRDRASGETPVPHDILPNLQRAPCGSQHVTENTPRRLMEASFDGVTG